jgi:hypothetical protein
MSSYNAIDGYWNKVVVTSMSQRSASESHEQSAIIAGIALTLLIILSIVIVISVFVGG